MPTQPSVGRAAGPQFKMKNKSKAFWKTSKCTSDSKLWVNFKILLFWQSFPWQCSASQPVLVPASTFDDATVCNFEPDCSHVYNRCFMELMTAHMPVFQQFASSVVQCFSSVLVPAAPFLCPISLCESLQAEFLGIMFICYIISLNCKEGVSSAPMRFPSTHRRRCLNGRTIPTRETY